MPRVSTKHSARRPDALHTLSVALSPSALASCVRSAETTFLGTVCTHADHSGERLHEPIIQGEIANLFRYGSRAQADKPPPHVFYRVTAKYHDEQGKHLVDEDEHEPLYLEVNAPVRVCNRPPTEDDKVVVHFLVRGTPTRGYTVMNASPAPCACGAHSNVDACVVM
jgi:hypothetical protein